jgi:hypothetical protein
LHFAEARMPRSTVADDSPSPVFIVDSPRALHELRQRLRSPVLPPARVVLDPVFVPDSAAVERRLNALYSDCGCGVGSAAALLAALAYGSRLLAAERRARPRDGLHGLAVLGGAALAGKAAGLVRSRVALLRLTTALRAD